MIIAIEGADGCGKTSVAEALANALDCEVLAFPNDEAATGPIIRAYLRDEWRIGKSSGAIGAPADVLERWTLNGGALIFQALQVANRMELMPRLLEAQRTFRDLVLARYWQSGWVYGQLDGLSAGWLERVHSSMVQPHISILLDAPAEACMERRAARDGAMRPERYEGKLDFTRKVVRLYRELWAAHAHTPGWLVIDATKLFADVLTDVIEACR